MHRITRYEEEEARFWLRDAAKLIGDRPNDWDRFTRELRVSVSAPENLDAKISQVIAPFVTRLERKSG